MSTSQVFVYGAFAVIGWLLLVVSVFVAHAPEKTTSELMREFR